MTKPSPQAFFQLPVPRDDCPVSDFGLRVSDFIAPQILRDWLPRRLAFRPKTRYSPKAMRCPFCDADKDSLKVIDSRTADGGRSIRRRRECLHCSKRFTTYEKIEERQRLTVVKKDGRRVPWDRERIMKGLERACFKRPVAESELLRIVDEVEEETFRAHDREAPSSFIGQLVSDKLRRVDQVAYVRFASVYRQFKTLQELVAEARDVLDSRRFEDPDQGRLFIEESARPVSSAQSNGGPPANGRKRGPSRNGRAEPPANAAD
jgi:transcriptional repressor NrdR